MGWLAAQGAIMAIGLFMAAALGDRTILWAYHSL